MKIRKPIFGILILLILSLVFAAGVAVVSYQALYERSGERARLKVDGVQKTLEVMENDYTAVYDAFLNRLANVSRLMGLMLKEYMENGQYKGPILFDDGFVFQLKDGKVIYPEGAEFLPEIDPADLTDAIYADEQLISGPDGEKVPFVVFVSPIGGNYYYVDLTANKEISDSIVKTSRVNETISEIEKSYGCQLIVVSIPPSIRKNDVRKFTAKADQFKFLIAPGEEDLTGISPEDFGITKEVLQEKPSFLNYRGKTYNSTFKELNFLGEADMAIILTPMENDLVYMLTSVSLIVFLTLITGIIVILWLYWHQTYVRDNELLLEQMAAYRPSALRKRAYAIALVGGIVMFVLAVFYQSLGSLYRESSSNREALNTVMGRLKANTSDVSAAQQNEEDWAVYFLERIALIFSVNERLRSSDHLYEINRLIGTEYLMLFDPNGDETVSSNGVIGYSVLKTEKLKAFENLLKGTDTLILEADEDLFLRKKTQLIGTPVLFGDEEGYGVLLAAIDAENTWQSADERSIRDFLENATPKGNLCLVLDISDSTVIYSSSPRLVSEFLPELGYKEGNPEDLDLDTFLVDNVRYYGSYDTDENYIAYYLTEAGEVLQYSFSFAGICAVGFLIIISLTSFFMLRPYSAEAFKAAARLKEDVRTSESLDMDSLDDIVEKNDDNDEPVRLIDRWRLLAPEQKTQLFLQVFLGLVLLFTALSYSVSKSNGKAYDGTITFILFGNWKHGLNLLGLAASLIVIFAFVIFIFFKNIMLRILCAVLDAKGETICRLTFSLLQYATVLGGIYLVMGFLGMNTTFQLTSIGIISLAISLGSKDIVADILAGIFIIFEGDFQVGDYVDINGFQGIVQEIGVRSTKVLGLGDNIKIFGNQNVKNVLNMSKMNTWLTLEYKLAPGGSLIDAEKLLISEMPLISQRIPEIISGPYYKGVWGTDFGNKVLHISCECLERHSRVVRRKVNHEVIVLLEENGFKLG